MLLSLFPFTKKRVILARLVFLFSNIPNESIIVDEFVMVLQVVRHYDMTLGVQCMTYNTILTSCTESEFHLKCCMGSRTSFSTWSYVIDKNKHEHIHVWRWWSTNQKMCVFVFEITRAQIPIRHSPIWKVHLGGGEQLNFLIGPLLRENSAENFLWRNVDSMWQFVGSGPNYL